MVLVDGAEVEEDSVTFESLGVIPQLVDACNALGFKRPTKIQSESLPYSLKGRDIIGLAQTGSGKTAAFALPILQALLDAPQSLFALVLAPTRELAYTIAEQFEALGSFIGVKCAVVVGGMDIMQQAIMLAKKPHILIGTPGRIVYHLEKTKGFNLHSIKYLVLDEADRLLNMEFEEEVNTILGVCPKQRNTFLFSATMTSKVSKLQRASLSNPVQVQVSAKYDTVDTLVQQYLFIPFKYKDCYLAYLMNEMSGSTAIVFTHTCKNSQKLTLILRNLGFKAISLNGDMSQPQRLGAFNAFKARTYNILVATDVASRGLDIPSVDLVVNYDVPINSKDYIHRVGRTARAGRAGRAITFVTQYDVEVYQRIEALIAKKLEAFPAEEETVLVMLERVTEASRMAAITIRESESEKGGKGGKGGKTLT